MLFRQLYRQYQTAKKYLPKGITDTLAKKFKYTGPKKKIDTQFYFLNNIYNQILKFSKKHHKRFHIL